MGSFFGNIQNAGKTQLKFDKVYPNRKAMETALIAGDGVFIDRFVLVEYDDNTNSRRYGYLKDEDRNNLNACRLYIDSTKQIPYRLRENDNNGYGVFPNDIFYTEIGIRTYYFRCLEQPAANGDALFAQICNKRSDEDILDYELNYNIDNDNYKSEMPKDGYDATIWRKILKNGEEAYQLIANLNTRLPGFNISGDAPSIIPIAPHFDPNSTNTNYTLHLPSNWGMKIKPAENIDGKVVSDQDVNYQYKYYDADSNLVQTKQENYPGAIYYNKSGFNPTFSVHSDDQIKSEISLLPTGKSGKTYYNHSKNSQTLEEMEDIQELKIYLPEIGNAIATMWDIVYGSGEELKDGTFKRNQDIMWDSSAGERLVNIDPLGDGFTYDPEKVETLAGCINSVHDLMGMLIVDNERQEVADALPDRIYYGPFGQDNSKGYFYKDVEYIKTAFTEKEREEFFASEVKKTYHSLTQFLPNTYHTELNGSFYNDTSDTADPNTSYFRLGTGRRIRNLKQWQPLDPETNEIQYSYYMNKQLDYIRDLSETPDVSKVYYSIETIQATNPEPEKGQIKTLLWNPEDVKLSTDIPDNLINEEELISMKITKIGAGYFYYDEKKKALSIINKNATYDSEYDYYYIPQFALGEGSDLSGATTEALYFIDSNKNLISFAQGVNDNSILSKYYIKFLPLRDNSYYYEFVENDEEGYRCLHPKANGTWEIDNAQIYYFIENNEETNSNTKYYEPGIYYIKTENNDFLLSTSLNFINDENIRYYLLTDKNGNVIEKNKETGDLLQSTIDKRNLDDDKQYWIKNEKGEFIKLTRPLTATEISDLNFYVYEIFKTENISFYIPGKYYYTKKYEHNGIEYTKDVIDYSKEMKTHTHPEVGEVGPENQVYFTMNWAYVIEDPQGVLAPGYIWNKDVPPPDDVVLGTITEQPAWRELAGFSRSLNTIHGLILHINRIFKFNDNITRDTTTIQGTLNKINDILTTFSSFNPDETILINEYGNLTSIDAGHLPLKEYSRNTIPENLNIYTKADNNYDTINSAILKLEQRIILLEEEIRRLKS